MSFNERLEIVELNAANEAVSLLNLNDGVHYMMEAGTFEPIPPEPTAVLAEDQRRYGGARQVGEVHGTNGSIEWVAGVTASTEQAALEKVETLLAQLSANPYHSYVLWQVPGASHPTLYEMRGTGTWQPKYSVATLEGAQLFLFQVHIPVAPLAQGLPVKVLEQSGVTLPETLSLSAIPGDAPALGEVIIETTGNVEEFQITTTASPHGVAASSTHVFWTDAATGYIGRASLEGTGAEPAWLHVEGEPYGVTTDATQIYWTDRVHGYIGRATLAGGSIEKTWITGLTKPLALVVNGTYVWWTEEKRFSVGRCALSEPSKPEPNWEEAHPPTPVQPVGLALAGEYLYFSSQETGAIGRIDITTRAQPGLLAGIEGALGLAVSSTEVYWASPTTASIGRAGLSGGELSSPWASVGGSPTDVAVEGDYVYFVQGEWLGRAPIEAGPSAFALLGWASQPMSGLAAAPFGVLDSSAAVAVSGWSKQGHAGARGGSALQGFFARNAAYWEVDPARMAPDSFSGEIAVEVWARVLLTPGLLAPRFILSAQPQDGTGYGAARYTDEWGSAGRPEVLPEGGEKWRFTRLGTLHLLVNPLAPRIWKLYLEGIDGATSELWGVDYLLLAPSLQRACSPSSKANNSSYPTFIANIGATVKTVKPNLSATVAMPGKNGHPDHGLGGQLLQFPPGEVDLLVKLCSGVPDDPEASAASEQLGYDATVTVYVTPRWFLARTV